MRRFLGFAAACVLLPQFAAADIYLVPPDPVPVQLYNGEQAISARAQLYRTLPPQQAYIQLAVLGAPVYVAPPPRDTSRLVKEGIEDPTPAPPLQSAAAVQKTDMMAAVRILADAGIPLNDITTMQPSDKTSPGRVIIAIRPPSAQTFDALARKIDGVLAVYPNIRSAGEVAAMNTCKVQHAAVSAATEEAGTDASILAGAAGLSAGRVVKNDERFVPPPGNTQFCGEQRAVTPLYDNLVLPGTFHAFQIAVEGGAVFAAKPAAALAHPSVAFTREDVIPDNDQRLVSHQFVIPADEPFISAQGYFSGAIRPDARVGVFSVPGAATQTERLRLLERIADIVRASGIPQHRIYRSRFTVNFMLESAGRMSAIRRRVSESLGDPGSSIASTVAAFAKDCSKVKKATAAAAFRNAFARAEAMAARAGLSVGDVIAVDDAGQNAGAICGYRDGEPVKELAEAIDRNTSTAWAPNDAGRFSRGLVVAWRLNGVKPKPRGSAMPEVAPPFGYSNIDRAFITPGSATLASTRLETTNSRTFDEAQRTALRQAVAQALGKAGSAATQAIIDQGIVKDWTGAMHQRVLLIYTPQSE